VTVRLKKQGSIRLPAQLREEPSQPKVSLGAQIRETLKLSSKGNKKGMRGKHRRNSIFSLTWGNVGDLGKRNSAKLGGRRGSESLAEQTSRITCFQMGGENGVECPR